MAGESLLEAYPLTWPAGQGRTPPAQRSWHHFKVSLGRARDELLHELELLGGREVVLSSNIPVRKDGLPYADAREPQDPGVAVYFNRKQKPFVIACDSYNRVLGNLRAIGHTVEALRTIQRHGATSLLEQAFTGFTALPPHIVAEASWWDVLGVLASASIDEIKGARDRLALRNHPDTGGTHDAMARINRAFDRAMEERRGQ